MVPLFKIFNSWPLIRALTVFLNNCLLIGAYLFMMRQTKISLKWVMLTSIFLLLPVNFTYWAIVTFGGYYTWFLAMFFILLGLFFILVKDESKKNIQKTAFVFFCLLSMTLGITGIRSLMDIQVPLFLSCLLICVLGFSRRQYELVLSIISLLFAGIGYIVNILLHLFFSFSQDLDATWDNIADIFFQKLGKILWMFVEYFGFEAHSILFTPNGVLSVFSIIFLAVIITLSLVFLRKQKQNAEITFFPKKFLLFFFISSMVYHVSLYQLIEEKYLTLRYFIPFLILYIPVLAVLFNEKPAQKKLSHFITVIILIVIFGHGTVKFNTILSRDITSTRKGYLNFLSEQHFDFGYASFWNTNVTTELTNGAVEMVDVEPAGTSFTKYNWLNPVEFNNPAYHIGKTFLLLTREEWLELRDSEKFRQRTPDFEDAYFAVLSYPSTDLINRELLGK
jgi:hypothetical protein